jgi:NADH:ubiquinone reductase (H+-translocating)
MNAAAGYSIRRDLRNGAIAGLVAAVVPVLSLGIHGGTSMPISEGGAWPLALAAAQLLLGAVLGAAYGALFSGQPDSSAAGLSTGLLYGLLWWILGPLTLVPLARGRIPGWSLEEAAAAFPSLIAYLLYGAALGGAFDLVTRAAARGHPDVPPAPSLAGGPHIVILGGGFGGVSAAQRLERLLARDHTARITLISQSNYLLFTPMLAEVAASGLEPQHISAPVRAALERTEFLRADVEKIDTAAQVIWLGASGPAGPIHYDQLILALGSIPNFHGLPGLEACAFTLKSLDDATRLRSHVIGLLERADVEPDPAERRRQLTFVVAGGGFAGTEMIAELRDLVHSVRRFYRRVRSDDLRFVLVHAGARILPELNPALAAYAQRKLEVRGIEFVLNARIAAARPDAVVLTQGEELPARTIVWTAGNQPHPLLRGLPVEKNGGGAVIVDGTLRVPGASNVWAVGDCAQVPDAYREGGACPPTAQHAIREGTVAADNVVAELHGNPLRSFRFRTIGVLVALGHRTAVAEFRGVKFSGVLAWFMWRTVYLAKLPGLEKKVRVALDWTLELFFPRDIAVAAAGPILVDGRRGTEHTGAHAAERSRR